MSGDGGDVLPLVVPVVAGVAYLFGTISVSAFSAKLGVAPRDLGVDFRDYLILAIANLAAIAAVMAAAAWLSLYVGRPRRKVWRATTVLLALAAFGASILLVRDLNINVGTYVVAVALSVVIAWLARREAPSAQIRKRNLGWLSAACLILVVVLLLNAMWTAESWGSELRTWAQECGGADRACTSPPHGPAGLALLFEPAVGTVVAAGEEACVVRIGEGVYLGRESVTVIEPVRFEVVDCLVQKRPLVPATGSVRVYGLAAEGLDDIADGTVMDLVSVDEALLHLRLEGRVVVVDRAAVTFEYVHGAKAIEFVALKATAPPT